jgi:hypothetical protein
MARSEVPIRAATQDDVPSIRTLLASHGNDGPIVYGDIVAHWSGRCSMRASGSPIATRTWPAGTT